MGNKWISGLCADIFEASRTISYVETVGSKADTLHKYISYADERTLKRAYELQARDAIKKIGIKDVELAIDGKKDFYYGKNGSINARQIKPEYGADEAWEFITLPIAYPVRVPLMSIPYKQGDDITKICIELLEYARSLPIRIRKVLFDRGFYIWHLIDYLESKNKGKPLPYLILVPKNDAVKEFIDKTEGNLGVFKHIGNYSKTKSNNPLVRFFYFLLRCLLTLVWMLNNIIRTPMRYKSYLRNAEYQLREQIGYKPPSIKAVY